MTDACWSDDRVTLMSQLWSDGLTAEAIAQRLGRVSRSAVLGKLYRLGLKRAAPERPRRAAVSADRPKSFGPRRAIAQRRSALAPKPRFAPPAPTDIAATPSLAHDTEKPGAYRAIEDMPRHACRWPIDLPDGATSFCGDHAADGRYCQCHAARAFRPTPPIDMRLANIDRRPRVRAFT